MGGVVKVNGGSESEKRRTMIIQRQEKQRQVVIKQKTEMHTEALSFAWNVGLITANKERKCNKAFVENFIFLKINKRGS